MKKTLLIIALFIPLFCVAQNPRMQRNLDTISVRKLVDPFLFSNMPGCTDIATFVTIQGRSDNFKDRATVVYFILSQTGAKLAQGSIDVTGAAYATWDANSNSDIYRILANEKKISIDYRKEISLVVRK